jgi:photosystem II stability/assembly factor-like uncharacterized protein
MEHLETEPEPESRAERHASRALAVIAVSIVAMAATGALYLHPAGNASVAKVVDRPSAAQADYQPAALDFVSPNTGWVVARFAGGAYVLLKTADGGQTWERQLSGIGTGRDAYLRFFDDRHGVFALLAAEPQIFSTTDGGHTWKGQAPIPALAFGLSVTFVDPGHGWLLLRPESPAGGAGRLLRTADGGVTWTDLGLPGLDSDQPFHVQFASLTTGWLDSLNSGPYAYRSDDAGATWRRIVLPAPQGVWPATGQFFVAAQPTEGLGVAATVVNFGPISGRSGIGSTVLVDPPLTVRAFDGGVPVSYVYTTLIDDLAGHGPASARQWVSASAQVQAPNQVQLGSIDGGESWRAIAPPGDPGAIGYADAQTWWWIGSGQWSRSSDGGATWTPVRTVGVVTPLPASLQLLDRQHAWFAAMAGTRPVLETTSDGGIHWRMVLLPPIGP